ncbi:hypothetical protein SCOR_06825 [Sulfidibacter corallicola]
MLTENYVAPETTPCVPPRDEEELKRELWQVEPPARGLGLDGALDLFREKVLAKSIKTWHPLFLNQMFAGASVPAIIGDLLAGLMNPTLATFEASPAGTLIERVVSSWMAQMVGMKPGSSGIFLPGGSLSNLMGLTVARNSKLGGDVRSRGVSSDRKVAILCSAGCHYSITNAANLLGLGTDSVIKVATNERNEMRIEDFKEKLAWCDANDVYPFAVVATMGITVTGGFDPLAEIVEVCRGRDIHIHVDAAFGGGHALTRDGRELFRGIEEADSVIWDAHKWLHTPLTCTVLLVPDPLVLKQTFASNADYLFHDPDHEADITDDLGQYTILCGKRFDALKVWLLFQTYGVEYFQAIAEDRWAFAQQVQELLKADDDFEPCYELRSPLLCFRFMPDALRKADSAYRDALHRWCRTRIMEEGTSLFNMSKLGGTSTYRMILINPLTEMRHIESLIADLRRLGYAYMEANPF